MNRLAQNLGKTLKNLGTASEKVLKDLDKADKKMDAKIKKSTGGIK